jgi:hypothetical protein
VECQNGIHVTMENVVPVGTPVVIETCIQNACDEHQLDARSEGESEPTVVFGERLEAGRTVDASVTVMTEDGDVLARRTAPVTIEQEPHGDCPPCRVGNLHIRGDQS